jgi:hypothetical protein
VSGSATSTARSSMRPLDVLDLLAVIYGTVAVDLKYGKSRRVRDVADLSG